MQSPWGGEMEGGLADTFGVIVPETLAFVVPELEDEPVPENLLDEILELRCCSL